MIQSNPSPLTRQNVLAAVKVGLERGMPIEQIQKFLGHSKLETTQVYAESSTEMMRESFQRALAR
jgi:integrase/recombinase XerD